MRTFIDWLLYKQLGFDHENKLHMRKQYAEKNSSMES